MKLYNSRAELEAMYAKEKKVFDHLGYHWDSRFWILSDCMELFKELDRLRRELEDSTPEATERALHEAASKLGW